MIRKALPEDAAVILELIRDLAKFEKLQHEVTATADMIRENLFGANPVAHAIIAEHEGKAVGFALYFFSFSTFLAKPGLYLEDLYVRPEFRGHGFGLSLLRKLAQIAEARDCGRMEWSVLNWNQKAIDLYLSLGSKPMDEWTVHRLTAPEIAKLARTP